MWRPRCELHLCNTGCRPVNCSYRLTITSTYAGSSSSSRALSAMRAAIYARVSTTDQTCDLQLRELRQYISARGWQVAGDYVDTGWSGAAAARPELDRLLTDARLRRIDVVVVWKLDRWG